MNMRIKRLLVKYRTLLNCLDLLVFIPNIPFVVAIHIYQLVMFFKNTPIHELPFTVGDRSIDEGMIKEFDRIYPYHLRIFISVLVYGTIIINI